VVINPEFNQEDVQEEDPQQVIQDDTAEVHRQSRKKKKNSDQ
jgi:hypothetical protein